MQFICILVPHSVLQSESDTAGSLLSGNSLDINRKWIRLKTQQHQQQENGCVGLQLYNCKLSSVLYLLSIIKPFVESYPVFPISWKLRESNYSTHLD